MAAKSSGSDKQKSIGRWHAVSVRPGPGACEAAVSGKSSRWLSREAPLLPLPGCSHPERCRCTYQHHEDRRSGPRRAEDLDAFSRPTPAANERRKRRSRRQSDQD
ncbi:MAG: hypothetical protein ACT4UP_06060 [Gammaproteobacteria bacterium]